MLLAYTASLNESILSAIQGSCTAESEIVAFERCLEFTKYRLQQHTSARVEPEPGYAELVRDSRHSEYDRYTPDWPDRGQIVFQNVLVRYREQLPPALLGLSLTVPAKCKVGVVGRTGAGKSTITLALLRVLEARMGCILVDGVDIAKVSLQQLRESITLVMQDAPLFEGTLRENVDPTHRHSDEECLSALAKCRLREYHLNQPIKADAIS